MRKADWRGASAGWMALLGLAALVVMLAPGRANADVPQPSYDTVPRATWMMDSFGWLARQGALEPYHARDFLISRAFTRMEAAGLLRELMSSERYSNLPGRQRLVVAQLVDEFDEELRLLGVDAEAASAALNAGGEQALLANAWLYGEATRSDGDTQGELIPVVSGFWMSGRGTTVNATVSNERRLFHDGAGAFPVVDRFGVHRRWGEWRVSGGRIYDHIGTANAGSLFLDDSSPALMQVSATKVFPLGRKLGDVRLTWQTGGFREAGETFYLITKKVEKTLSDRWSLAYIDMAKTTETPDPLMVVLPALAYQSLFLDDVDSKWNTLVGVQAMYRPHERLDTYVQWMVDDLNNPFDPGENVPKKTGLLFGVRSRSNSASRLRLIAEYAVVDERTYEATRATLPLLAWTQDGLPLAWPYGPNSRTLHLRGEAKVSENVDLVAALVDSRAKTGGAEHTIFSFMPTLQISPQASLGVTLEVLSGDVDETLFGLRGMMLY